MNRQLRPRQQRSGLRALTESALLAAITAVLLISGSYLPLVGPLLAFVAPLPIIVAVQRVGLRNAALAALAASLVLLPLAGPVASLTGALVVGGMGLSLGWGLATGRAALQTGLAGAVAAVLLMLVSLALTRLFFAQDAISLLREEFLQSLQRSSDLLAGLPSLSGSPGSGQATQQMQQQTEAMRQAIEQWLGPLLPTVLALAGAAWALALLLVSTPLLRRLGLRYTAIPAFGSWRLPIWAAAVFAVAALAVLLAQPGGYVAQAAQNFLMLTALLVTVQGWAVGYFFLRRWHVGKAFAVVILVVAGMNALLSQVFLWLGMLDLGFDFRSRVEAS